MEMEMEMLPFITIRFPRRQHAIHWALMLTEGDGEGCIPRCVDV